MDKQATRGPSWLDGAKEQGRIAMVGLLVVVVPLLVIGNAVDHLRKVVHKALIAFEPRVEHVGGGTMALLIVAALLICAWLIGRIMTHTELGQEVLAWEKRVFSKRSPILEKEADRKARSEEAAARAADPGRAGLAHIQGGWQPCMIVHASPDGLTSVFIPSLPSTEDGNLYVLEADRVRSLEMPLEEFRTTLKKYGHGGKQWAAALAAEQPTDTA